MPERRTVAELRALLCECPPDELPALISRMRRDDRSGVRELARAARERLERERREFARLDSLMTLQAELHARGLAVVAGVDEVGRGALAGPVTACAVVFRLETRIADLDDSKRLAPARRAIVAAEVRARAVAVCVAHVPPETIDAIGIAPATRLAWARALDGLGMEVDHVLVDGSDADCGRPSTGVVRGDSSVAAIAAASCVAKVERDGLMTLLAEDHPGYGFESNSGYGTAEHIAAIVRMGPSLVHRRSFAPCCQPSLLDGQMPHDGSGADDKDVDGNW
jgi:ribonuclease HII